MKLLYLIFKKYKIIKYKYSIIIECRRQIFDSLRSKATQTDRLPKIHKANSPLRPIVSQIDSPTQRLAKHVAYVLLPLRGQTRAHTRDSYHFVKEIKHLHLSNNETMVSFDVQSLFTSLPVKDCISIVPRKLRENNMPINMLTF